MKALCTEAAFGPLRDVKNIIDIKQANVRPININDFKLALKQVRASVSPNEITHYIKWNSLYGSFADK